MELDNIQLLSQLVFMKMLTQFFLVFSVKIHCTLWPAVWRDGSVDRSVYYSIMTA